MVYDLQRFSDGSLNFDTKVNTDGFSSGINNLGGIFRQGLGVLTGNIMTQGLRNISELGKSAASVGMSFETATSQIAATMGTSKDQIGSIIAEAKRLGAETAFSASQAAEGFNILAQSGLSASDQVAAMGDVLNLAAAGALSLDSAASYVTGTVKGFNDEMSNAQYYVDLMAKGASLANTSVNEFGTALSDAAASAGSYGQTADETALALLRLAEQNVTGAEAATALNRAMMDLYTPTSSAKAKLDELGVSAYDLATGKARPLSDVLADLEDAMAGMDDQTRNTTKNIIFSTFGLQAFNKMTVSSKEKVDELRKGISEAGGAAAMMAEEQLNNLEGRLTIMGSAAEALGIAVYEAFEGDMKRGVEAGTDAINRLQKSITDGKLGESLARLAEGFGNFLEAVISLAESALPPLIDALAFVFDHMDVIASVVGAVVTAMVAYNAAIAISELASKAYAAGVLLMNVAVGNLTVAEAGATATQLGLNAAMLANPVGLVAAAIAGLVAGLAIFITANSDALSGMSAAAKAAKEEAQAAAELNEQLKKSADARSKAVADLKFNADTAKKLSQELKDVRRSEEEFSTTLTKQKDIISQLNQLMPDLNMSIDEQTGALNMSTEALDKNIESWSKHADAQLAEQQAAEIFEQKLQAEQELMELEARHAEIIAEATAAREDWARKNEEALMSSEGMMGGQPTIIAQEQELKAQIDATKQTIDELGTEYEETQKILEDVSAMQAAEEEAAALAEAEQALIDKQNELIEAFNQSVESLDAMFTQMATSGEQALSALSDNLSHNTEAMTNYAENIGAAMDIVAANPSYAQVVDHFMQMGVDGAGYLNDFVQAVQNDTGDAERIVEEFSNYLASVNFAEQMHAAYVTGSEAPLAEFASNFDETGAQVSEKTSTMMADAKANVETGMSEIAEAGKLTDLEANVEESAKKVSDTTSGMMSDAAGEIEAGAGEITSAANQVMDEGLRVIQDALPKIVEAGKDISDKLASGIDSGRAGVISKVNAIVTEIQDAFKKPNWSDLGKAITDGVASGIRDGSTAIANAARQAAQSALDSAKAELGVNSPSRVFREVIGHSIPEGIDAGIKDKVDDIDMSWLRNDLVGNARAVVTESTGNPAGINSSLVIDYDLLGEKMADALENVTVSMDGKKVGHLTGNTINESLKRQSDLEERGVI